MSEGELSATQANTMGLALKSFLEHSECYLTLFPGDWLGTLES